MPIHFTPASSKYAQQPCQGIRITVTDRSAFDSTRTGWEVAHQLRCLFPDDWDATAYDRLLASKDVLAAIQSGLPTREIANIYSAQLTEFHARRTPWLLYE